MKSASRTRGNAAATAELFTRLAPARGFAGARHDPGRSRETSAPPGHDFATLQATPTGPPPGSSVPTPHPVQRMVGIQGHKKVYAPKHLAVTDDALTRYQNSVRTLTGTKDNLVFASDDDFSEVLKKNIDKETSAALEFRNKYTEKGEAARLTAKASKEQHEKGKTAEERAEITETLGRKLEALEVNPHYRKRGEVMGEFRDERNVFSYASDKLLESPWTPATAHPLLAPADMYDAPGKLTKISNPKERCAIEALSDLGADVKTVWSDASSSTDVGDWHRVSEAKGLDYRSDSEYIKLLGALKYTLVQNTPQTYNTIDWSAGHLGNGQYFLATGSADIGHAIGVTVSGGAVTTVHDRQSLHTDTETVKYIFKKP